MAQWGVGEPDEHGLYRSYDWPDWYLEYKRIRDEQRDEPRVEPAALWRHIADRWDEYVLPDFTRIYGIDTTDEDALLARPWWWLRNHLIALVGIDGSLTGRTFQQKGDSDEHSR